MVPLYQTWRSAPTMPKLNDPPRRPVTPAPTAPLPPGGKATRRSPPSAGRAWLEEQARLMLECRRAAHGEGQGTCHG
jgi:hypothetical protein